MRRFLGVFVVGCMLALFVAAQLIAARCMHLSVDANDMGQFITSNAFNRQLMGFVAAVVAMLDGWLAAIIIIVWIKGFAGEESSMGAFATWFEKDVHVTNVDTVGHVVICSLGYFGCVVASFLVVYGLKSLIY